MFMIVNFSNSKTKEIDKAGNNRYVSSKLNRKKIVVQVKKQYQTERPFSTF